MIAADLIRSIHQHGGDVTVDGDDLKLSAPQPLPAHLVDQLRTHKLELLHHLNKDVAIIDDPDADPAAEARRQTVLAMLKENPGITYAITSDTEIEPDSVIVTLAIRDKATCEPRIPKDQYAGGDSQAQETGGYPTRRGPMPTRSISLKNRSRRVALRYFLNVPAARVCCRIRVLLQSLKMNSADHHSTGTKSAILLRLNGPKSVQQDR